MGDHDMTTRSYRFAAILPLLLALTMLTAPPPASADEATKPWYELDMMADPILDQTLLFTSPIYLMELLLAARHFAQSPDLYASIQMANPRTPAVANAFVRAAQDLRTMTESRDHAAYQELFAEVRRYFGAFMQNALEQSDFLIDRLVERT
jgi:hypothetical protein